MDIHLPGMAAPVGGSTPVVIIGPNGVGKTQLGVAIARNPVNEAQRVAALRNVEIPEIPMQRLEQASANVRSALDEIMGQHWRQSYELQNLMAEILAEDRELAVKYRSHRESKPTAAPEAAFVDTRLARIVKIWNRHFPGRTIKIDYQPVVDRVANGNTYAPYPIAQMSEGERTALYLAARVVSCNRKVLVVDEPETFFHPLLARNLWNDLEKEAPNIRFVYITHDIPFALSRRNAQFAIARSESKVDLLPPTSSIPADVVADVLGAASFSITASRVVFCEGISKSLDQPILSAWHNCDKTAVVPVGSCEAVRECVSVFRQSTVTSGLDAYGYVDRDAWPDPQLLGDPFVKAHGVSEIEGLFCMESVFKGLARYNGAADEAASQALFDAFIAEARGVFTGVTLHKQILERAKKRVEVEQRALMNPIKPHADLSIVRAKFQAAAPASGWPTYFSSIFVDEETRLNNSLSGSPEVFIRDFPAKSMVSIAAKHLGFLETRMVQVLCDALRLSDEDADKEQKLKHLRDAIVPAIEPHMWPRRV